jgi:hypothetical protein
MSPLWTLAPVSVVLGVLMMWVFRRTTDREALRRTIRRMQAHLLEFWLYVDEPWLMGKSWKGLLLANLRFYRLLLGPLVILSIFMTPVFFGLDALYGSSPLPVGKPALVTLRMDRPLESLSPIPQPKAPQGIAVESPAVRVFSERTVSWRVRPLRPVRGEFLWLLEGSNFTKSVAAGGDFAYHSRMRARSLVRLLRYPMEMPLRRGPVEWIEIDYPPAAVSLFGLEAHWSIWFLAFSLCGAVLSRGK